MPLFVALVSLPLVTYLYYRAYHHIALEKPMPFVRWLFTPNRYAWYIAVYMLFPAFLISLGVLLGLALLERAL